MKADCARGKGFVKEGLKTLLAACGGSAQIKVKVKIKGRVKARYRVNKIEKRVRDG